MVGSAYYISTNFLATEYHMTFDVNVLDVLIRFFMSCLCCYKCYLRHIFWGNYDAIVKDLDIFVMFFVEMIRIAFLDSLEF